MPANGTRGREPLPSIVLLTCRPRSSDFRYHLARELQAIGHDVTYIFVRRRPEAIDMETGAATQWSLAQLLRYFFRMRMAPARRRPIIFNSTNLAFAATSAALRALSGTRWCLDMHDDLLYNTRGWQRGRAKAAQRLLLASSDMVVHAAATLQRLFPASTHIGNGSSLKPAAKSRTDPSFILVLASLDGRFDFQAMAAAAAACPNRRFEIHGRVSQDDPGVQAELEGLVERYGNITYHGAYTDDELPDLLARYLVAFAPYKVGSRLTEFIDPLRFYHCLASSTGLVSTAIPQALSMREQIVVLDDVQCCEQALDEAIVRRSRPSGRTWRDVAEAVSDLLSRYAPT